MSKPFEFFKPEDFDGISSYETGRIYRQANRLLNERGVRVTSEPIMDSYWRSGAEHPLSESEALLICQRPIERECDHWVSMSHDMKFDSARHVEFNFCPKCGKDLR